MQSKEQCKEQSRMSWAAFSEVHGSNVEQIVKVGWMLKNKTYEQTLITHATHLFVLKVEYREYELIGGPNGGVLTNTLWEHPVTLHRFSLRFESQIVDVSLPIEFPEKTEQGAAIAAIEAYTDAPDLMGSSDRMRVATRAFMSQHPNPNLLYLWSEREVQEIILEWLHS